MAEPNKFRHILLQLSLQMLLSTPEAGAGNCKNKDLGEIKMSEMKKEVRYAEDKPKSCKYCYFWSGKKKGCELGEEKCYYLLPEEPKKPAGPCDGCPYGRNNPCIGFCMKKVLGQK